MPDKTRKTIRQTRRRKTAAKIYSKDTLADGDVNARSHYCPD
ncbi:MAG: hypothetical protein ACLU99_08610 [Alphaproteobacteria bacterium]